MFVESKMITTETLAEDVPLFGWDHLFLRYQYIKFGLLFDGDIDKSLFERNLQRGLVAIPLYAGRFVSENGMRLIRTNKDNGIYIEYHTEEKDSPPQINHVSRKEWSQCFKWNFIRRHQHVKSDSPLLALKVIYFKKHDKTVICFYVSHIVGDFESFMLFLQQSNSETPQAFSLDRKLAAQPSAARFKPLNIFGFLMELANLKIYNSRVKRELVINKDEIKKFFLLLQDYYAPRKIYRLLDMRGKNGFSEKYIGTASDLIDKNTNFNMTHYIEKLYQYGKLNTVIQLYQWLYLREGAKDAFSNILHGDKLNFFNTAVAAKLPISFKIHDEFDAPGYLVLYERHPGQFVFRTSQPIIDHLIASGFEVRGLPE